MYSGFDKTWYLPEFQWDCGELPPVMLAIIPNSMQTICFYGAICRCLWPCVKLTVSLQNSYGQVWTDFLTDLYPIFSVV